ncbi:MAG: addiction module protein [Calditrichia bacterium]
MSGNGEKILTEALALPPLERAELIEMLFSSFEFPSRKSIDALWGKEAEERIDAYDKGNINARSAKKVFEKINKN